MSGKLYICATPIGNMEDITLRVLRVLKEVKLIAAEDTRQTIKLLNHYDIKTPMTAYHEHNEISKSGFIIEKLKSGEDIALVSDAGMPGISDPGLELIKRCIENDVEITVCPGPSASLSALVLSGLDTKRFAFEGFLPHSKKDKKTILNSMTQEKRTLIFYEAPHRLKETLVCLLEILGDRKISAAREITKKFEEIKRERISDLIAYYVNNEPRGEFVIIVEGNTENCGLDFSDLDIETHIGYYINQGFSKMDAIKAVAKERRVSKKEIYDAVISEDRRN